MAGPSLRLNINTMGVKASQQEMLAAFNKISDGAKKVAKDVDGAASATERLGKRSLNPMKAMGNAVDKAGGSSKNLGYVLNNVSNQIGDFAVQVGMGTSAVKALGMQAPQAAGALSMLGGPFVAIASVMGLVAALGLPLISMFMNTSVEADELGDQLDDLADKIDNVRELLDIATMPISDLSKEYGGLALSVKEAAEAIANLEFAEAQRTANNLFSVLTDGRVITSDLAKVTEELNAASQQGILFSHLSAATQTFIGLREELGLTDQTVLAVAGAFQELDEATTNTEKSQALLKLVNILEPLKSNSEEGADALTILARDAYAAGTEFARLARLAGEANDAVSETGALLTVVEAPRLSKADRDAAAIATGDPFDEAQKAAMAARRRAQQKARRDAEQEERRAAAAARVARNKEINELKRVADTYTPALTAAQEYADVTAKIARAVEIKAITEQEGAIATAEATRQYQIATGELTDYTSVANTFARSLEDSMMALADGTGSVKDAFKSMATMVIKELLRVLVVQRMVNAAMGVFGFAPAAGGGYIPIGGVGNYGGPVQPNKGIVVGESGPEVFYPQTQGTIVPNNATGGNITVNQTINVSTGVQQTVRTEIKSLMPQIAESAKAAVADAKRRGGSYGKAFA